MRLRASKLPRRWSIWKRKAGMEPRTHPPSLQEQCWLLRPHRKAGFQKRGASVPADAPQWGWHHQGSGRATDEWFRGAARHPAPSFCSRPLCPPCRAARAAQPARSPALVPSRPTGGPCRVGGAVLAEGRAARLCRKPQRSCSSHRAGDGHKFSLSNRRLQGSQETVPPVPRFPANSTRCHAIASTSPSIRPPDEFHLHRESVKIVPIA